MYFKDLGISLKHYKTLLSAICVVGFSLGPASASTVQGGALMSSADADQLEAWLGIDEQVFTNIFTGQAGVARASDFHAAADGVGPTISIYEVTIHNGSTVRIGGYTAADWGGNGYQSDPTAFIFNLDTGEMQTQANSFSSAASIFARSDRFPTFGGGHDIFSGQGVLGTCNGRTSSNCDGYTYSWSYDTTQGQISVAGDTGTGGGGSGVHFRHIAVQSLEVFTFAAAPSGSTPPLAPVPLPASGLLLLAALGGAGAFARRQKG